MTWPPRSGTIRTRLRHRQGDGHICLSGQAPVRRDGSAPGSLAKQADPVCANIAAILGARRVPVSDIIKLTKFLAEDDDGDDCRRKPRTKHRSEHSRASTEVIVRCLVGPAWKIEIYSIARLCRQIELPVRTARA